MKSFRRALVLAAIAFAATPALAFGAAAIKGATYRGTTVQGTAAITLKVSKSGNSVTVNFGTDDLCLYDFLGVFDDGDKVEKHRINVCEISSFRFTED